MRNVVLTVLMVLIMCGTASADTTWEMIFNQNPETDISGYKVYGSHTQSGPYDELLDCGVPTRQDDGYLHCNVTVDDETWYFVLTAYGDNQINDESDYSVELIAARKLEMPGFIRVKRVITITVEVDLPEGNGN